MYLNKPIQIGTMTVKNRIMMVAMHHLYTENGLPTPRFNQYYWKRAEGGAGLVVVGACRFDQYGARASTMKLDCEADIPAYGAFLKGMHDRGCKVALQLYHAGRYLRKAEVMADDEAIAPSPVYTPFTRETARAMTKCDIDRVIADFAAAADRAKRAGFDAVEISCSAGYLLTQFLSPLANVREDEYGGSFENRTRFPMEVIAAVRQAVGKDFPVLLRLGSHDLVPGSNGSEECLRFAKLVSDSGMIDLLDVTGGWHESRIPQLTGEVPRAGLLYLAGRIRAAVDIPVAMANRMGDPRTGEQAVALGQCDMVAMGRPLVADPDLPNKLFGLDKRPVRPCVACNQGCLAGTFFDKPVRCLVNSLTGQEYLYPHIDEKTESPENILVVGGGPAGCEAALRLAQKGHSVTLWEAENRLGGQLRLTAALPAREEFGALLDYYEKALEQAGVLVVTGFRAAAQDVLAGGFDRAVLATGRSGKALPVEIGENAPAVYTAEQVIREKPVLGKRVAVIGGSFVGLETARLLAREGSLTAEQSFYMLRYGIEAPETVQTMCSETLRQVAVFEKGKLGAGYEPGIAWPVLDELGRFKAELFKNTRVLAVADGGVVTEQGFWPCDAVVVCPGTEAESGLYEQLKAHLPCQCIGNAQKLGRAIDAIASALQVLKLQ